MKVSYLALVILYFLLSGCATPGNGLTPQIKQRVQRELRDDCLAAFLNGESDLLFNKYYYQMHASKLGNVVFAVGESDSKQYCNWEQKRGWDTSFFGLGGSDTWDEAETKAIAQCDNQRPTDGGVCVVYAHNNNILYVNLHAKLKEANAYFEVGDISATLQTLEEIKSGNILTLTKLERGEYAFLSGKILLTSQIERDRLEAITQFHQSWATYQNPKGAAEEGNLRMSTGEINKHWQSIREAYQYFLANASVDQKAKYPEVEQNLKQVESYYQAELVQKQNAIKDQERIAAIKAKHESEQRIALEAEQKNQARVAAIIAKREAEQKEKQDRLNAINAENEKRLQERNRRAEEKRIAREGDGSDEDKTCKRFGAKPGSQTYISCRLQLDHDKKTEDNQRAAQIQSAKELQAAQVRAANEKRAAQIEYQKQLNDQRQAEAQRQANLQDQQFQNQMILDLGASMRNIATPPKQPTYTNCTNTGGMINCSTY